MYVNPLVTPAVSASSDEKDTAMSMKILQDNVHCGPTIADLHEKHRNKRGAGWYGDALDMDSGSKQSRR